MASISDFLEEIDRRWVAAAEVGKIRLRIIGSSALMLQTGYERGTKDSDAHLLHGDREVLGLHPDAVALLEHELATVEAGGAVVGAGGGGREREGGGYEDRHAVAHGGDCRLAGARIPASEWK